MRQAKDFSRRAFVKGSAAPSASGMSILSAAVLLLGLATAAAQTAPPPVPKLPDARALLQQGKLQAALAQLKAVEAADPNTPGLARLLGTAYYRTSRFGEAIPYLKRATEEDSTDREAVQLLGFCYYLVGRMSDAIPLLAKVREWFPATHLDASYYLGVAYIQTRSYDQARKAFASMLGVADDSAAGHLFLARMLLRQEFEPVAEEEVKKALEKDPELPLAHFLLGELYMFKSKLPEAVAEFEKELAINPVHAATYTRLGDAYLRLQKLDEAEPLLQRSIYLDSTSSAPYILLGKLLLHKNEAERASLALQRAISVDPNNYIAHYLLSQAYRALGKADDSQREAQLAERLQSAQHPKLENVK